MSGNLPGKRTLRRTKKGKGKKFNINNRNFTLKYLKKNSYKKFLLTVTKYSKASGTVKERKYADKSNKGTSDMLFVKFQSHFLCFTFSNSFSFSFKMLFQHATELIELAIRQISEKSIHQIRG